MLILRQYSGVDTATVVELCTYTPIFYFVYIWHQELHVYIEVQQSGSATLTYKMSLPFAEEQLRMHL